MLCPQSIARRPDGRLDRSSPPPRPPQIPGLERSLRLIVGTSHLLVGAAFVAEVLSELCYAELLGRSVGTVSGPGFSSRVSRRRGMERWFMLRLTVTGYGVSHVLPGGGAVTTTMTYRVLRRRGFGPEKVGLALAAIFYPTLRLGAGRATLRT